MWTAEGKGYWQFLNAIHKTPSEYGALPWEDKVFLQGAWNRECEESRKKKPPHDEGMSGTVKNASDIERLRKATADGTVG